MGGTHARAAASTDAGSDVLIDARIDGSINPRSDGSIGRIASPDTSIDGSDASTASGGSDVHNDHAHNGLKGGPAPPE